MSHQIFVKTLSNVTIILNVELNITIKELKEKIYDRDGTPAHKIYLLSSGRYLEDNKTLNDYNIIDESTIYVHIKFCDTK